MRRALPGFAALAACGGPAAPPPVRAVVVPAATARPEREEPPAAMPATDSFEIAIGLAALCARVDGRVHCGDLADPNRPLTALPPFGGIDDVVSVAMGNDHVCVATRRGTVHCSGDNTFGELGAGLRADRSDEPKQVANVSDARRVIAGAWHTCAILASGAVRCWGRNQEGQTGDTVEYTEQARELVAATEVPGLERVRSLAAGGSSTCAVDGDGNGWCWGRSVMPAQFEVRGMQNDQPFRLGELAGIADMDADEGAFCGVRRERIACWGDTSSLVPREQSGGDPPVVIAMPPARKVRLGRSHGCALLRDGRVSCFGEPYSQAFGRPVPKDFDPLLPAIVPGIRGAIDIAVGASMSCAIGAARDVQCWGQFPGADWNKPQIEPTRIRIGD